MNRNEYFDRPQAEARPTAGRPDPTIPSRAVSDLCLIDRKLAVEIAKSAARR